MGSWNHTCAVSNLHIRAGKEVAVFLLVKNYHDSGESFCYGNALYDVVPLPFYGKYNDYGGVEDCHGAGLPYILEALKSRLYKFGQGPNQYHDCEVTPDNLDIEKLFEADHENRLGIHDPKHYDRNDYDRRELEKIREEKGLTNSQQYELDRLASLIKKKQTFRQVTHVVVHGDVFKTIMEKWYIEHYVGEGRGNTGWDNNYVRVYFRDVVADIPEYIEGKKTAWELLKKAKEDGTYSSSYLRLMSDTSRQDWNSINHVKRMMGHFKSTGGSNVWALIDVNEVVDEFVELEDWDGLADFVKEALTAAWINSYMSYTRKIWVKQCGTGSQSSEHLGYQLLANTVLEIIKEERREYGEDEDWDENDPENDMNEQNAESGAG